MQDPEVSSIMQQMGQAAGDNRGREKRFIFDHAFDGTSTNTTVYRGTVQVRLLSSMAGFMRHARGGKPWPLLQLTVQQKQQQRQRVERKHSWQ